VTKCHLAPYCWHCIGTVLAETQHKSCTSRDSFLYMPKTKHCGSPHHPPPSLSCTHPACCGRVPLRQRASSHGWFQHSGSGAPHREAEWVSSSADDHVSSSRKRQSLLRCHHHRCQVVNLIANTIYQTVTDVTVTSDKQAETGCDVGDNGAAGSTARDVLCHGTAPSAAVGYWAKSGQFRPRSHLCPLLHDPRVCKR
jgi:hypothetical protein